MIPGAITLMRSSFKYAPYIVIALLIGVVLLRSHQLTSTREQLKTEQNFRVEISEILGAPNGKAETVRQTARAVTETSENRRRALETIDRDTAEAKRRADANDAELERVQQKHRREYRAAEKKITELEQREATGIPEQDQQLIEDDSKAPWEGWQK